ncbi:MAG TPA: hypothetical protein DDX19_15695 [Rhodopirellula baltica]|nr:hypothetical protein [Rhodopirellula baltica]
MANANRLANGQIHRSQGHRPWDSNRHRSVWPTAKFNWATWLPNSGESGYQLHLILGRTVFRVLRRAAPLARRPWTSLGHRSISS